MFIIFPGWTVNKSSERKNRQVQWAFTVQRAAPEGYTRTEWRNWETGVQSKGTGASLTH